MQADTGSDAPVDAPVALVLATAYLPPIQHCFQYFHVENIWIEAHENFQKGDYRSRCCIATANGVEYLSIPLKRGKNKQSPIQEVQIANDTLWQRQHWRAIRAAYGNAPYFAHYAASLAAFYDQTYTHLWEFNTALLHWVRQQLGFPNAPPNTLAYQPVPAQVLDWRRVLSPKEVYYTGDALFFPATYPQVFSHKHGFLANMSILDALMCMGTHTAEYLRHRCARPAAQ